MFLPSGEQQDFIRIVTAVEPRQRFNLNAEFFELGDPVVQVQPFKAVSDGEAFPGLSVLVDEQFAEAALPEVA